MHEVLVNRLGGLSLPRKSVVRLTDRPDMTLVVYRGRKTTIQYNTIHEDIRIIKSPCHENIATDIQSRTICRTVCFDSTDRNFAARIGRLIYI